VFQANTYDAAAVFVFFGLKVARSRARFFRGDRDLLLYTGRAHFFNRYCIRGIHHLIFYSLPEFPQFYPEMVNLLEVRWRRATVLWCLYR